jgi:ATP adenylyltransferase
MSLERLWAGWRDEFVSGASRNGPKPDCVFDAILGSGLPDTESHIVWRHPGGLVVALLNAYPYTSGHLMIVPTRHVGELEDLTAEEGGAVWAGVSDAVRALKAAYSPEGLNVGVNLGRAAGAGVPGHFHVHVLPRWVGDTNFMTTVADTRVLPEPLSATDAKVRAAWPTRSASRGRRRPPAPAR